MHLAINYSPPAARLVQSGQIEVDFFKTPDWDWMVDEAKPLRPVAVHFTMEAGNGRLGRVGWNKVEQLAQLTSTPYINLHLDARQKNFPWLQVETARKSDIDHVLKIMLADVMVLVNRYGADRIVVENSPYRGQAGNTLRLCVEPDLIRRIVAETGCGMLLDIPHAIIAATHIGMEPYEYFSRLPVHKVREMHYAGIHPINGQFVDHLSILDGDWSWLDWALAQIRSGEWSTPWLLAFEYGGVGAEFEWRSDPKVIVEQVPKLRDRINNE